jgi:hypothetical protein
MFGVRTKVHSLLSQRIANPVKGGVLAATICDTPTAHASVPGFPSTPLSMSTVSVALGLKTERKYGWLLPTMLPS